MDFLFGFMLGYLCKEIFSYLKKLSNNKKEAKPKLCNKKSASLLP